MTYPVTPVIKPTDLKDANNGMLPDALLVTVPMPNTTSARLHHITARAWNALAAKVLTEFGVTLCCTSGVDTYRSYNNQVSTFYKRTVRVSYDVWAATPKNRRRTFADGKGSSFFAFKPGVAPCATPGTSNHGWGLAIDMAIWDTNTHTVHNIGTNRTVFTWLLNHARTYGFSWESQSENWHIRYVTGDTIPTAVIEHETNANVPPFNPDKRQFGLYPLDPNKPPITLGSTGDIVKYAQAVLGATIDGTFGPQTGKHVIALRTFFGDPNPTPVINDQWWPLIDIAAQLTSPTDSGTLDP